MAIDWTARTAALAALYDGLSSADGSVTLRASHAAAPDSIAAPCAVTLVAGFSALSFEGSAWLTGTADIDVLVLLEPSADVPRRYAALLKWVQPAMTAAVGAVRLGDPSGIAAAVPVSSEFALAGDSEVYAGMPWDMVRVRYQVPFRERVVMVP